LNCFGQLASCVNEAIIYEDSGSIMNKHVNLVKLSVGSHTVSDLVAWQKNPRAQGTDGYPRHVTRMWPKREKEIVTGGSIYWVIKGQIQCRQKIIRLDEIIGNDGIRRCAIVLDKNLILTTIANRRAFQGWRYLNPTDSPSDLNATRQNEDPLPPSLAGALADIGVI
jgi:hypothetical protein